MAEEQKSGLKSSTFWLSAGTALLGFLVSSGVIGAETQDSIVNGIKQIIAGAAMIWPVVNYGIQRTKRGKQ